jgi:neutral ceramidase
MAKTWRHGAWIPSLGISQVMRLNHKLTGAGNEHIMQKMSRTGGRRPFPQLMSYRRFSHNHSKGCRSEQRVFDPVNIREREGSMPKEMLSQGTSFKKVREERAEIDIVRKVRLDLPEVSPSDDDTSGDICTRAWGKGLMRMHIYFPHFIIVIILFLSGCGATISGTIKPPAVQRASGTFLAGASKMDITPPPGYPMGGHSIAGQISRGHWLRLFTRSIFLEDMTGTRIVFVAADLWSIPAGLADRVADLNSRGPAECTVGRAGLILAATHTHQSPGNFSSSPMYNEFASPVPGFDPDLFGFLASRIASSVEEACKNRREAQVFYSAGRMRRKAFARNRSFEAFLLDREARDILQENADLPVGEKVQGYPFPESYHAIDPTLRVLRIREAVLPNRDIAIAAFVAVHATSLTHEAEVYNSDLFGVAAISAERRISSENESILPPVVAIFNGAEGDISPAWVRQDRRDTLSIGEELAENILSMTSGRMVEGSLYYRFLIEGLAGKCLPESYGKTLCTDTGPVAGAATLGGAEDGRTIFYNLGWKEGIKGHSNAAQDPKQPAFDLPFKTPISLTRTIGKVFTAPKTIPIGVYALGPLTMATLPGEFTMVLGRRIALEVKDHLKDVSEDIILIGLANEYLSYFTTPEEYEEQSYEGASMLYGKAAGAYVGHALGILAGELQHGETHPYLNMDYRYDAGPIRRFGVQDIKTTDWSFIERGLSSILEDTMTGESILSSVPAFCWGDRVVDLRTNTGTEATPRVSLATQTTDRSEWVPLMVEGHPEDDRGLNFVTVVLTPQDDLVTWCTFWMLPSVLKGTDASFRFSVRTLEGKTIQSTDCMIREGTVNNECLFDQSLIPAATE